MLFRQFKSLSQAFYALFADSGFAMAGAVAYAFVLSFFPVLHLPRRAGRLFRRRGAGKEAVAQLFEMVPAPVARPSPRR